MQNSGRDKFKEYPNFSVITGKFEEIDFEAEAYDFIYSASAFHWVPEETGYPKVFSMLKSGGVFARFANHPFEDKGRQKLSDEIQELYVIYMNPASRPVEYTSLLGTYSDHIAMEENKRAEFFSKIEQAINKHGGKFTVYDTMDLQLARKP